MKETKRILKFLLFTVLLFVEVKAFSNVAFYHYGIENGLPESKIVSISQDSVGFIWLAGENGMYRFDGNRFNIYQTTFLNSSPVPFVRINTIYTDTKGTLWVGSNDGLSYFNSATNRFIKLGEGFEQQRILDIFEDKNGILWLASEFGLAKFNPNTEKTDWFTDPSSSKNAVYKNLPANYIVQITGQPDGKIWLVTYPFGLWLFDPETGETEDFNQTDKTDFSQFNISEIHYKSGTLYLGTLSNGFFWLEPKKRVVQRESLNQMANAIQHFRQLNDSIFWLATNNGLFQYNILTGGFTRYTNEPNNPLSLNRTTVNYVFLDIDENLWLSLGIRGINYGMTNVPFSHFLDSPEKSAYQLAHKEVTSIQFDFYGNMWLGYESGLIEKHTYEPLSKKQYRIKTNNSDNQSGSILAIFEDSKNRIWAGGWQSGINVLIPGKNEFEPAKIKPGSVARLLETADLRGITEDKNGNIWISFHGIGFGKYNPESQTIKIFRHDAENPFTTLSNNFTYNLCFDVQENLWIASAHGISRFDPKNEQFTVFLHEENNPNSLNSNTVSVVYCDSSGIVWAGTEKGLNVYSPTLDNFIPVFTDKDFPFLNIASIQSANPGELWISTNDGIFRLNHTWNSSKTEMEVEPTGFNRSDGLLSSNYFPRSSATSGDGSVFFCGNEGIDFFYPEDVSNYNEIKNKVLITEIWIDDKTIYPNQITGENNKMNLVLNHNHRILSIRFTALGFSNTGIKNFRFKLDGVHDDWVYLQNEQQAFFNHLPPGKYTFSAETQQKNNEWTGDNSTIEISVKRPFWLTIPFYILVVLISTGIFYFILKARSRVLVLRQKELKKIIEIRTQELTQKNKELEMVNQTKDKFFSIISHDLRSPFLGLLGILELLTEPNMEFDEPKQTELLQAAKKSTQNTFELLENLLMWSRSQMKNTTCTIEKHNISEILRKNINLKKETAHQKKISISEHFADKIDALFDKEMINTVIRNILNNAIKFTHPGGKVNILAENINGEVKISISDTGIGLSEKDLLHLFELEKMNRAGTEGEKGTGLGLIISKEFIEKNNGKIWATNNSPQGTIFHFTLPKLKN
ncbi:MAG: hypothetical protein K0B11_15515 [Mariniphaga sp.]|nr:hypothetical protein [Mariniphaga sp.]